MPKLVKLPLNVVASQDVLNHASSSTFKVGAKAADDSVELLIHGAIGDDWSKLDSGSISGFLSQHKGKKVRVDINSPGGLAYDGVATYNALAQHDGLVEIDITGIAASAATIIAMAGDKIRIAENGSFMIHRAWAVGIGNQNVMLSLADFLDKLDNQIAATYAARTGRKVETMLKLMDGDIDGTTFNGTETVSNGFADEVIPLKKKSASNSAENQTVVTTAVAATAELAGQFEADARLRESDAVKVRLGRLKLDDAK